MRVLAGLILLASAAPVGLSTCAGGPPEALEITTTGDPATVLAACLADDGLHDHFDLRAAVPLGEPGRGDILLAVDDQRTARLSSWAFTDLCTGDVGAEVALKADWTRRDPVITEWLRRSGRAGVPMYLVIPADRAQAPILLPEVITPSMVVDALARAGA